MKYGFIRVAAATHKIRIANTTDNTNEILKIIELSYKNKIELLVFPELCLTGYTCGELFLSEVLIQSVYNSISKILKYTINTNILIFIGAPIYNEHKLYSCAIALQNGKILGIIPKTFIPSYSEFYESRYFASGKNICGFITLCNQKVYFGTNILFRANTNPKIQVAAEICEDMFVINPPSNCHAKAGASIIVNLSASNELIGKSKYRKILIMAQSKRLISGYIYASAGCSESVSDMIFSGYKVIVENGNILKESKMFKVSRDIITYEIDVDKLAYERRRVNVFNVDSSKYHIVDFNLNIQDVNIQRYISPYPFIKKCIPNYAESILQMQSRALVEKLKITNLDVVIGLSGGIDSCLALLVTLRSYKILHRDKKRIIAITMPGPGTSIKSQENVSNLVDVTGIKIRNINICKAVDNHLRDINHNGKLNNTYENAQARERTQILMDIANAEHGMVLGTGNLSENALGWNTYNGDHMSMYAINASVPKTLIRYLVNYESKRLKEYQNVLLSILYADSSPELIPTTFNIKQSQQRTEQIIGPYELHDFFLYYIVRFGQTSDKTLMLAYKAFKGKYSKDKILKYLKIFIKRFFANQFKRNCLPDGLKITNLSLSPRADWRMASDSSSQEWLNLIEKIL
ncbi:MAG: NAD(+) synthase [Endomicrobium sp.]|jgi:NAD+ synthase (glutamine-hydrolysing)|nr:NAD(+) synthase [Endomicrobium sp.]